MNHHFIREMKETKADLCVVTCVITAAAAAVEIKRKDKKNVNINLLTQDFEIASKYVKDMLIEPGTTLAYKVWPLDKNEVTGEIIPVMMPKKNEITFRNPFKKRKKHCSHYETL